MAVKSPLERPQIYDPCKDFTEKIEGVACASGPTTTFLNFLLYVCKKVPGKITDKDIENLMQASGEI